MQLMQQPMSATLLLPVRICNNNCLGHHHHNRHMHFTMNMLLLLLFMNPSADAVVWGWPHERGWAWKNILWMMLSICGIYCKFVWCSTWFCVWIAMRVRLCDELYRTFTWMSIGASISFASSITFSVPRFIAIASVLAIALARVRVAANFTLEFTRQLYNVNLYL